MADTTKKDVLVSVNVVTNYNEAVKSVDSFKNSIKLSKAVIEENIAAQKDLNRQVSAGLITDKEKAKESKRLQDLINSQTAALNAETIGYAKSKNQLKEATKELQNAAKTEEVFNVATEQVNRSLGEMRRELVALKGTSFTNMDPEQIQKIKQRIADLADKIKDANVELKGLNTGEVFTNMASGLQAVSASAQLVVSAFGENNEAAKALNETTLKLISTTQALGVISDFLKEKKYALIAANLKALTIDKIAEVQALASAKAKQLEGKATIFATVQQKIFNAVAKANPYVLLAIAILSVGAALCSLSAALGGATQAEIAMKQATSEANKAAALELVQFDAAVRQINEAKKGRGDLTQSIENYNKTFGETGKLTKDIVKNEKEFNAILLERRNIIVNEAYVEAYKKQLTELVTKQIELQENLDESKKGLADMGFFAKLSGKGFAEMAIASTTRDLEEMNSAIADVIKQLDKYQNKLNTGNATAKGFDLNGEAAKLGASNRIAAMKDGVGKELALLKQRYEDEKKEYADSQDYVNALTEKYAIERNAILGKYSEEQQLKGIEQAKSVAESIIKAEKDYQSDDFAVKLRYEQRLFDLERDTAMERLKVLRSFGKLTKKEFEAQEKILTNQRKEFQNKQKKEVLDFYADLQKDIANLVSQGSQIQVGLQVADVNREYDKLIDSLNAKAVTLNVKESKDGLTGNEFDASDYKDIMATIALLETEKETRITQIQEAGVQARINTINEKYSKMYEKDFEAFANNEIEKLKLQEKMQGEKMRETKEKGEYAGEGGEKQRLADTAALEAIRIQLLQTTAAKEIALAGGKTKAILALEKKLNDDLLGLYNEDSKEYAEQTDKKRQLRLQELDELISNVKESVAVINEVYGYFSEIMSNMDEKRLADSEARNTREHDQLQLQLDNNLISRQDYDKRIKQADADLAKEKAAVAKKQAMLEKSMAIFNIGVNTALAIMKNTGTLGFIPAIPVNIVTLALGALQIAAVASKPIPKAARGSLIGGYSHAAGGTMIEAERGEAIVNKRSVGMFPELLSLINEAGGGVPFTTTHSDGGFSAREYRKQSTEGVSADAIADAVKTAIQEVQIYTAIEDINKGDRKYVEVSNSKVL